MQWFVQLCMALDYIHCKNIIHRDLKPQNIFMTSKRVLRLGDFGISKVLEKDESLARTNCGTPWYQSPQVWKNKPYSNTTDIWSLGCILYELCMLRPTFKANNATEVKLLVTKSRPQPISNMYSEDLQRLVKTLLTKDGQKRPTVNDILRIPIVCRHVQ